jgi:hypothetical protein
VLPGGEVARGRRPAAPQRCPSAPQLPDDNGLAAAERQRALCGSAARVAEAVSPEVVLDASKLTDQLAHCWSCTVLHEGPFLVRLGVGRPRGPGATARRAAPVDLGSRG